MMDAQSLTFKQKHLGSLHFISALVKFLVEAQSVILKNTF